MPFTETRCGENCGGLIMTLIVVLFCLSFLLVILQSVSYIGFIYFKKNSLISELRRMKLDNIADECERVFGSKGKHGYKSIAYFFREKKCLWQIVNIENKSAILKKYGYFLAINQICFIVYIAVIFFIVVYYLLVVQHK